VDINRDQTKLPENKRPVFNLVSWKERNVLKWLLLTFSLSVGFLYLTYFWLVMLLRNQLILGGRRK